MAKQYLVVKNPLGRDVSQEIELKNGKANPFGWSQYEVHHEGKMIGWLESGDPSDFRDGYTFSIVDEKPANWDQPKNDSKEPDFKVEAL